MGRGGSLILLLVLGAGWGLTMPLTKIAVSTGHGHFGLIFWQMAIGALCMGALMAVLGRRLPWRRDALRVYVIIALIGTLLPNTASLQAIVHLPSGMTSVLLSLIPMIAFPMALLLRLERFRMQRLVGLGCGLAGVLILIMPEAGLPAQGGTWVWVLVALIAPAFYAFEGNFVARWGTAGLDAAQVLCGASIVGTVMSLPLAVFSGQFIWPAQGMAAPEWAQVASSVIHVAVYTGYVWLVGRAGPVFAVQVSYLVTGFGVLWAMLILGESYAAHFWVAMGLVLGGVALVQPRPADPAPVVPA